MIHHLHGTVAEATPGTVVVDVQGVGYEVHVSSSAWSRLPPVGSPLRLLTHLVIREDAHTLFGFLQAPERDLFRLLIDTVSGIGPRIALNILGAMPADQFAAAIQAGDLARLSRISGIGKRTAERLVVELKGKLGTLASSGMPLPAQGATDDGTSASAAIAQDPAMRDAILALTQLGRKPAEAESAIQAARALLGPAAGTDQLVRAGLRGPAVLPS
jgi:Holliday junction DNA helicase RuvA